jgi:hypothetical protein
MVSRHDEMRLHSSSVPAQKDRALQRQKPEERRREEE